MNGTVDLGELRLFAAVADARSFSGAARRLGIPKSSVSRRISRLEADLGVSLLHRTTRRVAVTTEGEAFLARVTGPLGALGEAVDEVRNRDLEPSGDLRVTAPTDLGATLLAEIVTRFTARYSGVRVDVHLTNRFVDLVAGGFDLALRVTGGRMADSSLVVRRASPIAAYLVASPAYLGGRGTPRSSGDLGGHDWVVFRRMPAVLRLQGGDGAVSVAVQGRVRGDDLFFVREAARAGAGIGVIPSFLAEADLATGALVRVLPRHTIPAGTLSLAWPATRYPARKAVLFRALVLSTLRARPLAPPSP